jgi:predicted amidohydrolase YtcJ
VAFPVPDFRFRIEHAQVTNPLLVAKFNELKVIASMQPHHVLTDMNWAEARLGSGAGSLFVCLGGIPRKGSSPRFRD